MRAAVGDTLVELGKKNDRIVVIDAETAVATNILPFKEAFPDRFLTTVSQSKMPSVLLTVFREWDTFLFVPLFAAFIGRRAFGSDICAGQVIRMPISS